MYYKILFSFLLFFSTKNIISINSNEAYTLFSNYINEKEMYIIIEDLYKKQPSFFNEDPREYFPINEYNLEDFLYSIEPLANFLEPLLWGNIVFPLSINHLSSNFNNLFINRNESDNEKTQYSDIIIIKGGTYPAMKKELLYIKKIMAETKEQKPIFLLANSSRINTNLYYESFDNIVEDIQTYTNRALSDEDLLFISNHLNNEYEIGLIIERFFDSENLKVIDFTHDPFLLNFKEFLKSCNYDSAKLLILSNNIFTLYQELRYKIHILNNPEFFDVQFPIIFAGYNITLMDPKNPEGILLRKLKMLTVLLNLIIENIDN